MIDDVIEGTANKSFLHLVSGKMNRWIIKRHLGCHYHRHCYLCSSLGYSFSR